MKLNELNDLPQFAQAVNVLESQSGKNWDFSIIGPKRARGMLTKVQSVLREHRSRPDFHSSERDPRYLKALMLEQALQARVAEQDMAPMAIDVNDPKTKATMQKAQRGQQLSPEEQKTMTAIALMKKEGKMSKSMVKEQNELQQAQVVLAAQDMIDRVQGMIEDISEMQFKDLPALANSIKNDMGAEQSAQFQQQAAAALTQLLTAMQTGKAELEAAQGVLTGQELVVPGADAEPATEPGVEPDLDVDVDADLDIEEPADISDTGLGRERR